MDSIQGWLWKVTAVVAVRRRPPGSPPPSRLSGLWPRRRQGTRRPPATPSLLPSASSPVHPGARSFASAIHYLFTLRAAPPPTLALNTSPRPCATFKLPAKPILPCARYCSVSFLLSPPAKPFSPLDTPPRPCATLHTSGETFHPPRSLFCLGFALHTSSHRDTPFHLGARYPASALRYPSHFRRNLFSPVLVVLSRFSSHHRQHPFPPRRSILRLGLALPFT